MPGVVRPIHILWNQVIGFFFIVLATHVRHIRVMRGKERQRPPAWSLTSLSSS